MKKSIIFAAAVMLSAATVSYSQSSASNANGQSQSDAKPQTAAPSQNKQGGTAQSGNDKNGPGLQQAQKTSENDGATRPGGETHENANDVGRYSENEDSRSMLFSREAIELRRKNMTVADTTVKEGSGSGERNTKNHTGFTGNYQNNDSKQSQKPKSRE